MMISEYIKDLIKKLLIVIFLFFTGYYFLMGSSTQTPEEFDKEFIENMTRVSKGQKTDAMKEFQKRHVKTMRRIVAKLF